MAQATTETGIQWIVCFISMDRHQAHRICIKNLQHAPFLVPPGKFQKHLHTLANLAKLLQNRDFRDGL